MNELETTRLKLKCLEMVEGTKLNWWEVIQNKKKEPCYPVYLFFYDDAVKDFEFALGVVEGKPVWEGDTLYHIRHGKVVVRKNNRTTDYLKMEGYSGVEALASSFSWNPPAPKTVMVELPIECVRALASAMFADINVRRACIKALEQMR